MSLTKTCLLLTVCFVFVFGRTANAASQQQLPQVFVTQFMLDGYPTLARQANVMGDVTASVTVNGDGTVASVADIQGPDLLRGEADLIRSWRFAIPDGKPKQVRVVLRYTLRGESRKEGSTLITATLPQLIEITTNPAAEEPTHRRRVAEAITQPSQNGN